MRTRPVSERSKQVILHIIRSLQKYRNPQKQKQYTAQLGKKWQAPANEAIHLGMVCPSIEYLAKRSRLNERTVREIRLQLIDEGRLEALPQKVKYSVWLKVSSPCPSQKRAECPPIIVSDSLKNQKQEANTTKVAIQRGSHLPQQSYPTVFTAREDDSLQLSSLSFTEETAHEQLKRVLLASPEDSQTSDYREGSEPKMTKQGLVVGKQFKRVSSKPRYGMRDTGESVELLSLTIRESGSEEEVKVVLWADLALKFKDIPLQSSVVFDCFPKLNKWVARDGTRREELTFVVIRQIKPNDPMYALKTATGIHGLPGQDIAI